MSRDDCEVCGDERGPHDPDEWTVSYRTDDGELLTRDWRVCRRCFDQVVKVQQAKCPFCLEPVMQDEDPRECPQRPAADRRAGR